MANSRSLDDVRKILIEQAGTEDRFPVMDIMPIYQEDKDGKLKRIYLQLSGWAIVINDDGTWYWEDTSGG